MEGIKKCVERRKFDGFLAVSHVPVITFSALFVVPQDTFAAHNEGPSLYLKGFELPGTGSGRCQSTTSKKAVSSITVRDFSISLPFTLL